VPEGRGYYTRYLAYPGAVGSVAKWYN